MRVTKKKEFKEITLHCSFLLGPGTGIPAAVEPRELCSDACRLCWRLHPRDQVMTFVITAVPNKTAYGKANSKGDGSVWGPGLWGTD